MIEQEKLYEHPCAMGDLTEDGIQYSAEKETSTDDWETVEEVTVWPKLRGQINYLEFGLTCSLKSSGTLESVLYKWQARNKDGTWVDLHTEGTYAANASAWKEYTRSGRYSAKTNLDFLPIDLRLQIKSGGAGGETAFGKTKNSGYVLVDVSRG